jgi:hypothetical protein
MLLSMAFKKLQDLWRAPATGNDLRVVRRRPLLRALLSVAVAAVVVAAVAFGFWLGDGMSELDRSRLDSFVVRHQADEARLAKLNQELADLRLARTVDTEAARSLRQTIGDLRGELATLNEELAFYRSLMAPSTIERGLRVAEFQLAQTEQERVFAWQLLLTQVAERRDWLQGRVEVQVRGHRASPLGGYGEEVLPLTELSEPETYPLRFRFRYFQDLSGTLTLPEAFVPTHILVAATPAGSSVVERQFDWSIRAE